MIDREMRWIDGFCNANGEIGLSTKKGPTLTNRASRTKRFLRTVSASKQSHKEVAKWSPHPSPPPPPPSTQQHGRERRCVCVVACCCCLRRELCFRFNSSSGGYGYIMSETLHDLSAGSFESPVRHPRLVCCKSTHVILEEALHIAQSQIARCTLTRLPTATAATTITTRMLCVWRRRRRRRT